MNSGNLNYTHALLKILNENRSKNPLNFVDVLIAKQFMFDRGFAIRAEIYMQNEVELFYPGEHKRIIAKPTFEGLVFSTTNLIALAKYLLANGVSKVCLRVLTQDVLEALFGNLVSKTDLKLLSILFHDAM